jgi:hypothetical protein
VLGLDKLFEFYCAANNIKPDQMNRMIIVLLVVVVLIQIISAVINICAQFALKRKDMQKDFASATYSLTRAVYEHIYNECRNIYRNILTSTEKEIVEDNVRNVTIYISDNDIHITEKMKKLSTDMIDKIQVFNLKRIATTNKDVQKAFSKFKSEYKKYDNY